MKHTQNSSAKRGFSPLLSASALVTGCLTLLCTPSCKPFDVNVSTAEPITVDLSMDVHVYQHGAADKTKKATMEDYKTVMGKRRDRMAQIQELKNNRLVGETHQGTLAIRNKPAADYGKYVEDTVRAENEDREFLIAHEAGEKGITTQEVREAQWRHWQRKSFPGEWIEVEADGAPDGFKWVQKEAAD